jgi:hypothetical protein
LGWQDIAPDGGLGSRTHHRDEDVWLNFESLATVVINAALSITGIM